MIPRLELRAALLTARLLYHASQSLEVPLTDCFAWSDSEVVLHWLHSTNPLGNDLVDSYVSCVQELLPSTVWSYVSTRNNPADVASGGTIPQDLCENQQWWKGPSWLLGPEPQWPRFISKLKPVLTCLVVRLEKAELITRFSCLTRMLKTLVLCRRFIKRLKAKVHLGEKSLQHPLSPVRAADLQQEFLICVRIFQESEFPEEIEALRRGDPIPGSSPLRALNPFLDDAGTLRRGGRLSNSLLCYEEKYPVILIGDGHLARLVVDWAHVRSLHGGFKSKFAYVLKRAWLIGGRTKVKARLRLPTQGGVPSRPFSKTGVDFAGPFPC